MSDAVIKVNVPIYGTKDAGRMFWKRLREVIIGAGMRPNKHIKALYTLEVDGVIKIMLATHVDDLMWTAEPGYEHIVQKVLETFDIRKIEQGEFRFCGREVKQNSQGQISVSCKSTTESILPISFQKNGRKNADKATDGEIGQLRSVVGSLAWICRQCRPELSYAVSRLQSLTSTANVGAVVFANKTLEQAKQNASRGFIKT